MSMKSESGHNKFNVHHKHILKHAGTGLNDNSEQRNWSNSPWEENVLCISVYWIRAATWALIYIQITISN